MKNELQHLATNQGGTKKRKLWSKVGEKVLRELPVKPCDPGGEKTCLGQEMLNVQIGLPDQEVAEAAEKDEKAGLLMTRPVVGADFTSMAFVLTIGDVNRFQWGEAGDELIEAERMTTQFVLSA